MKGSSSTTLERPAVADIVRAARMRRGVSQRDLAERSGIGLRTLREIERGRVQGPRSGSLRRLARALEEPELLARAGVTQDDESAPSYEGEPLVLGILGRLTASRGAAELATGTPMQQCLLGLMALQPNRVVERDEIIDVLWGDQLPDSFGQLIHTYVSRIRLMLEAHHVPGTGRMTVVRRGGGYELHIEDSSRLDLLESDRLTSAAERARADGDLAAEQDLLDASLRLWRGPLLEGMPPALRRHPVAVERSRRCIGSVLRIADLALTRGRYEDVLRRLTPIARHEPLHEGLHARLVTALAGSGRRAEALDLFVSVDRRLREQSGIGPGGELRSAQMAVLREDVAADAAPVRSAA
ncbi:BTAD domain-containing putative transcriptional regulator [Streptomyces sp. NPDC048623]|uniref:BTAD domain-containing putative transcriptional regulator n=1 Tax=Streptomyces sp. NPDC048623 TaxID=3155761 RepID=UPI003443B4EB